MKWLEKTHGVRFELVRHFLRRMFEGEWSSSPGQWRQAAIGVFSLFLPAGLLLVREGSPDPSYAFRYRMLEASAGQAGVRAAAMADELALITLLMCVTGLIALLEWQSLFPSRRDYLALASLPIRSGQVFAARFTSALVFSAVIVAAVNLLPSLIAPMEFGGGWRVDAGFARQAMAQAASSGLACAFIFFAILALQGVLLNILPANLFARVSVYAQGLLTGLFLLGGLYSWSMKNWTPKTVAKVPAFGQWFPPAWFAGLNRKLTGEGDAFLLGMAHRALVATGIAVAVAVAAYWVSYRRYRKLLLEAPVRLAAPRAWRWSLLRLLAGSPRREAVMEFMAKTLARSRTHRLLWLVYLGAAVAVVLNSSIVDGAIFARGHGWIKAVRFLVLFWPLACSVMILSGFRHVLSIPAELGANWIFQLTESQGRAEWASAVERFVLAYAVAPIYLILFPVQGYVLGWGLAVRLIILQVLISLSIFELLFHSWQKLPFTCSHLPSQTPLVGLVGRYAALLGVVVPALSVMVAAGSEVWFLFPIFLANFGGHWIWFRRLRKDGWGEAKLLYEDIPTVVTDLGIKELTYAGTEAQLRRAAAGDAGHADSEDSDSRPDARVRGGGIHPTDLGRRAAGGGGSALSGAASAGAAGAAGFGMGRFGEQPAGQVLPADGAGAQAIGGGGSAVAAGHTGHRPHYGTCIAEGEFGEFAASLYLKLRALLKRRELDRDLEDELEFHLSMREEEYMRNSGAGSGAEAAARRRFGNLAGIKERCRDLWTFAWIETLWQDLRFAARQLRRCPGFAVSAAVTLALGIGATTAVYSMLDTILWRPVPLPDLRSLVFVYQAAPGQGFPFSPAPAGDVEDIRRETTAIESLASWQLTRLNVVGAGGEPVVAETARVSPNLFALLRVQPALGRTFRPDEDRPGRDRVAIVSDSFWRQHFTADPGIVGRTVRVDGQNVTVVGVMPPEFRFPRAWRDLWVPLALTPESRNSHSSTPVETAGRLRPGQTLAQAAAELNAVAARLEKLYPETHRKRRFVALSFSRYWNGDLAPVFASLILGATLFVLLIACVNVANLEFARATGRAREVAVRTALGSGRARLVQQLLTESVALAALGAALGLAVAKWMLAVLKAGVPFEMRHYMAGWDDIGLNGHALGFTLAAALASGIVAGMAPALRCLKVDLTEALKEGGHGSAGRGPGRWRAVLVAGEIALATVLLTGAVLMVRGFRTLVAGGSELRPSTMLTMRLALSGTKYRENFQVASFYRVLLERAGGIPGVQSAIAATGLPYSRRYPVGRFVIEGREQRAGEQPSATMEAVTPNYFKTMFVRLRSGRLLSDGDGALAPPAVVVSARAAARWWPGENPVGRRIKIGEREWATIVGVVSDIPYTAMSREPGPAVYVPFAQAPDREMDIGLRLAVDAVGVAPAIQALVRALDPELPITNLNTMDTLIRQESFGLAFMAGLMGVSGLLALVLSAVGVYGVMAYSISARAHETGIRMALGARRGQVLAMLLRSGMRSALAGLALGLIPAWGLARAMQSFVWGVKAADGMAFVGVPLLLIGAAALAIAIPAVRATRIDPVRALRHE